MKIVRTQLNTNYLMSLNWFGANLVDWVRGGIKYSLRGEVELGAHNGFHYKFDTAIQSKNGIYQLVYEKLGTKGVLLKNGEVVREINRSFYCADDYEYPATFIELPNGNTILAHCPKEYCRIDFEEVETGQILTDSINRTLTDIFYSRLTTSPNNKLLLNRGWVWHPIDCVSCYDIKMCLANPKLLDESAGFIGSGGEICAADFITDDLIVLGTSENPTFEKHRSHADFLPAKHIGIWDIHQKRMIKSFPSFDKGLNFYVINDTLMWDVFKFPKLINLKTGLIEASFEDIDCGEIQSSIISNADTNKLPHFAVHKALQAIAIGFTDKIYILQITE